MSKPTLYVSSISPTCQRVFATLFHKKVDWDVVEIDIAKPRDERPQDFLEISPLGQVPVMKHEGNIVQESIVICEYADEVWPDVPMLPKSAGGRAYARRWLRFADSNIIDKDIRFVHYETEIERKHAVCHELFAGLNQLDRELAGKSAFFLGEEVSLVDAALAPTMGFLPIWSELVGDKTYATYANIHSYTERLRNHPTFAQQVWSTPREVYWGFFTAVLKHGLTT